MRAELDLFLSYFLLLGENMSCKRALLAAGANGTELYSPNSVKVLKEILTLALWCGRSKDTFLGIFRGLYGVLLKFWH